MQERLTAGQWDSAAPGAGGAGPKDALKLGHSKDPFGVHHVGAFRPSPTLGPALQRYTVARLGILRTVEGWTLLSPIRRVSQYDSLSKK